MLAVLILMETTMGEFCDVFKLCITVSPCSICAVALLQNRFSSLASFSFFSNFLPLFQIDVLYRYVLVNNI